jgi:hypothetical protein
MTERPGIAVVYLMWIPYGMSYFRAFAGSYERFSSGVDHQLYIVFNGVDNDAVPEAYIRLLHEKNITFKDLRMSSGQDIDAYFYAARQIDSEYILFLNTYSTFNSSDWLLKYYNGFSVPGTAAVGATASFQSHRSTVYALNDWKWNTSKTLRVNFDKYKLLVKAFFYWSLLFKPFPNPHLRTNAFMVRRNLFLGLIQPRLRTKFDAYVFESGRKGMTNQLLRRRHLIQVVDKYGTLYPLGKAKESHTFWIGQQEGLLIADNQTRMYDQADQLEKTKLTRLAWGKNEEI